MKIRTTLAAIAIATLPGVAIAEGCGFQHMDQSASQCPDGHALDKTTGTCVKLTTS